MRKKPKQARSKELVDALVEATALVLVDRGLDGLTTHYVAEAAGVSVGSLYQYFDSKEDLVAALIDKLANEITGALRKLPMSGQGSLQSNVRAVIQFGFALLESRDGLYLELARNWHQLPTDRLMDLLQDNFMDLSRLYFLKHYHDTPIEDLHVRIYIISNSVMFTMVRFVGQPQVMMNTEQMVSGLTEMVVKFLQQDADQKDSAM